jgi:hypothetical protein
MSSDVYEKRGLVGKFAHLEILTADPLMEILGQDLEFNRPQIVGTALPNGDTAEEWSSAEVVWRRCRNAVMVVSRIPLEPLPGQRKNEIFVKLLELDRGIVSGKTKLKFTDNETMDFLVVIRGALIRYGNGAGKTVVEVF